MAKELPKSEPVPEREPLTPEQVAQVITSGGDIGSLTLTQRAEYLVGLCKSQGLNPLLKPFDFIPLQGSKLTLYANKSCAAQLRDAHNISVREIYSGPLMVGNEPINEIYTVKVEAYLVNENGQVTRTQIEVGASSIAGLKGDMLANKIMHTYTKAVRRATLAIKGIGIPDESELEEMRPKQPLTFTQRLPEKQKPLDIGQLQADIKADPALVGE